MSDEPKITSIYAPRQVSTWSDTTRLAVVSYEAELATRFATHFAMIAGKIDGEDSAGRSKLSLMPVQEVIDRAVCLASGMVEAFEREGWIEPPLGITCSEAHAKRVDEIREADERQKDRDEESRLRRKKLAREEAAEDAAEKGAVSEGPGTAL